MIIGIEMGELAGAYLPHTPRDFREIVLADLLRAQCLILRIGDEIDPQFRIASPKGDWWIGMTLSEDQRERKRQIRLVSRFMAWRPSPAFTLASEIISPDAVHCIGVSHHKYYAAISRIMRNPLCFGEVEWFTRAQIGGRVRVAPATRLSGAAARRTPLPLHGAGNSSRRCEHRRVAAVLKGESRDAGAPAQQVGFTG